jgi:hypothetical protein
VEVHHESGQVRHLWIEGVPRRMDGKMSPVEIYYRDSKSVNGLTVPHVLETRVQGAKQLHKMTIENVAVKPKLEHSLFTVPKIK